MLVTSFAYVGLGALARVGLLTVVYVKVKACYLKTQNKMYRDSKSD